MMQNFQSTVAKCTNTRQLQKLISLYEGGGNLVNCSGVIARAVKLLNVSSTSEGLNDCLDRCVFVKGMNIQDAVDVIEVRSRYSTRLSEAQLLYMEEYFVSQFHNLKDNAIPTVLNAYAKYSVVPSNLLGKSHAIVCDADRFTLLELSNLMSAYVRFSQNLKPLLTSAALVIPKKVGAPSTWMSILSHYANFDGKWRTEFIKPVFDAAARHMDTRDNDMCFQCVLLFHKLQLTPPTALMFSASRKSFEDSSQVTALATAFMSMRYFSKVMFDSLSRYCHPFQLVAYVSTPAAADYVREIMSVNDRSSLSFSHFCILIKYSGRCSTLRDAVVDRLRYCDDENVTDSETEILVEYLVKYFPRHQYEMGSTWSNRAVVKTLRAYQNKCWGGSCCVPNTPNPLARFQADSDADDIILVAWSLVSNKETEQANLLIHRGDVIVEDICDANFIALTYLFVTMARQAQYALDEYIEFIFDAIDSHIARNGVPLEHKNQTISILCTASNLKLQDLDHYLFLLAEAIAAKPDVMSSSQLYSIAMAASYYCTWSHPFLKALERPSMEISPHHLSKIASVSTAVRFDSPILRDKIYRVFKKSLIRSVKEVRLLQNHFNHFRDERTWNSAARRA